MEEKIIKEFLTAAEIEEYFKVMEITSQCQQLERYVAKKEKSSHRYIEPQTNHFKKHLFLLLHAQLCRITPQKSKCQMRHCEPIQQVLGHALNCQAGENCSVRYCRTARRLSLHYEICRVADCPICIFASESNGLPHRPRQIFYKHIQKD